MDLSSQEEGEMPIPINSTYGHAHMIHHDPVAAVPPHHHHHHHNHIIIPTPAQIIPPTSGPIIPTSPSPLEEEEDHVARLEPGTGPVGPNYHNKKMVVKYRECLKNHAASMGGNATDGCGEFMPSGEEGTIEALTCSACNCHRNFHRKETEGDHYHHHHQASPPCDCSGPLHLSRIGLGGRKLILGHPHNHHQQQMQIQMQTQRQTQQHKAIMGPETFVYPHARGGGGGGGQSGPGQAHHPMIMSYNMGSMPSESDEQDDGGLGGINGLVSSSRPTSQMVVGKKRFRTKFSQEQKEKMFNFAEKVGWKIQKQEESVVQQLCQEIGVKRRVLKVWMHNNKHNLAKKNSSSTDPPGPALS